MDTIVSIIQTVGVPIAFCIALAWYVLKRDKRDAEKDTEHADMIKTMRDAHRDEVLAIQAENGAKMDALKDALTNNTVALTQLATILQKEAQ